MSFEDIYFNEDKRKSYMKDPYFMWLYDYVCEGRAHETVSYKKIFSLLYDIQFEYSIPNDANRAADGIGLRYRYAEYADYKWNVDKLRGRRCSVLEMMIALAIRCEETIMDNPRYGDRTKQWFWMMMSNLRLSHLTDDFYNKKAEEAAIKRIETFLKRKYSPNGDGGLFHIRNCDTDLRDVEIWAQLLWYLDTID